MMENMNLLQNKMELKELVDVFSILADKKDTKAQAELFTEDATLKSYIDNQLASEQHGREEIYAACTGFLALFDTVYHINGQQVVEFADDTHATGMAYCQVVLIGKNEDGKRMMNTQGVWYEDEYIKLNGKWLIANRTSHFKWDDRKEVE